MNLLARRHDNGTDAVELNNHEIGYASRRVGTSGSTARTVSR